MNYFKKYKDTYKMYEIVYDYDDLVSLRDEISKDLGYYVHKNVRGNVSPDYLANQGNIVNFCLESVRTIDCFYRQEFLYHYSYDEYVEHELVQLIDRLLDEEDEVYDSIVDYGKRFISFPEALRQMSLAVDNEKLNSEERITQVQSLVTLIRSKSELEKIYNYYLRLCGLIRLEFVDLLDKNFDSLLDTKSKKLILE